MADVFKGRSATLKVGDKLVTLSYGDSIPKGADADEVKAMRANGDFRDPPEAFPGGELSASAFSMVADPARDLAPESELTAPKPPVS